MVYEKKNKTSFLVVTMVLSTCRSHSQLFLYVNDVRVMPIMSMFVHSVYVTILVIVAFMSSTRALIYTH